jgi:hypothetical protein
MLSKNKIAYDYKKAIKQGGKIVGFHLYINKGILGAGKYVGNLWKTKTGDA